MGVNYEKILSLILAFAISITLSLSVTATSVDNTELSYSATDERCISLDDAVKTYEEEKGVVIETYRNYFYIPDGTESFFDEYESEVPTWYNEYFTDVCIWYNDLWCENAPVPSSYCGYSINKTDVNNIYYADIPVGVNSFLINNGVDEKNQLYYSCDSATSLGPDSNFYYDESYTYCEDMIYVFNSFDIASMSLTARFYGEWYYYYGDGCYGTVEDGNWANCVFDDHFDESGEHKDIEYLLGDVDKDNEVSIIDATEIQMVLAQLKPWFGDIVEVVADVDGDGEVSVLDATAIQLKLAGLSE